MSTAPSSPRRRSPIGDLPDLPRLTAEEEQALARRRLEWPEARWRASAERRILIESCIPLALRLAAPLSRPPLGDDAFSIALAGLCHAADRFDPGLGVRFTTYSGKVIQRTLHRDRPDCVAAIHVPAHVRDWQGREAAGRPQPGGASPRMPEFAEAARRVGSVASLAVAAPGFDLPMDPAAHRPGPPEEAALRERRERLARAVARLPWQYRVVFTLYYHGFDGGDPLDLAHIGRGLGLCRERARQVLGLARLRLRRDLESWGEDGRDAP